MHTVGGSGLTEEACARCLCAVSGHGVSEECLQRQFQESRRFFELPLAEKLRVRVRSCTLGRADRSRYIPELMRHVSNDLCMQRPIAKLGEMPS